MLRAVQHSDRLARLQSRVYRPLDRAPLGQSLRDLAEPDASPTQFDTLHD